MPGNVFISYRTQDARHAAGRLHKTLARILGEHRIFLDTAMMAAGEALRPALVERIRGSFAVIVVIGQSWSKAASGDGRRVGYRRRPWAATMAR